MKPDEQQAPDVDTLLRSLVDTSAGERIRMQCGAADLRSVITDTLALLQQPVSERCGGCGHVGFVAADGLCQFVTWTDGEAEERCSHKCVFPTTGAPPISALTQLLSAALLHPESAEGYVRQAIEMLVATTGASEGAERRSNHFTSESVERGAFPSHISRDGKAFYNAPATVSHEYRKRTSDRLPDFPPTKATQVAVEAATKIGSLAFNLCEESLDNESTPDENSMQLFNDSVASIISKHCAADAEIVRLREQFELLDDPDGLYTETRAKIEAKARADGIRECVDALADYRKWYAESMFTPLAPGEAMKVHERWPGLVDRISAEMGRHTIDKLAETLESLTKTEGDDGPTT